MREAVRIALLRARLVARLWRDGRLGTPRRAWAFASVPRHRFAPGHPPEAAWSVDALPTVDGQTLTCPTFVALMTQLADVRPGARVLEVGTGTGYQAAILRALGARVTTVEVRPSLAAMARANLPDVDVRVGDGALGAPDAAPFDAILLGCAPERIPHALLDQLRVGGRLVAPEGGEHVLQQLVVIERTPDGWAREVVRAAWFVPMVAG